MSRAANQKLSIELFFWMLFTGARSRLSSKIAILVAAMLVMTLAHGRLDFLAIRRNLLGDLALQRFHSRSNWFSGKILEQFGTIMHKSCINYAQWLDKFRALGAMIRQDDNLLWFSGATYEIHIHRTSLHFFHFMSGRLCNFGTFWFRKSWKSSTWKSIGLRGTPSIKS